MEKIVEMCFGKHVLAYKPGEGRLAAVSTLNLSPVMSSLDFPPCFSSFKIIPRRACVLNLNVIKAELQYASWTWRIKGKAVSVFRE